MSELLAVDLDGTLIDTGQRQARLAAYLVSTRGLPPLDHARFWREKREGATTEQALVKMGYGTKEAAVLGQQWRKEIEADQWLALDQPLPGVEHTLMRLAQSYRLAVLTARQRPERAQRLLQKLTWSSLFEELVVVSPSRAIKEKASWLRQRNPVCFVGDTESDAAAAAAARVPFLAVACGQRTTRFLLERGCQVLTSLSDVSLFLRLASYRKRAQDYG